MLPKTFVAYADEMADEFRASGQSLMVGQMIQTRIQESHPLSLGLLKGVTYNDKTDRYTAKFENDGQVAVLKITAEVGEFLLANARSSFRRMLPFIHGSMTEGTLDGVLLLFLSKND